VKSELE
jgi:hypothetical protein